MRLLVLLLPLLLAACADGPPRVVERRVSDTPAARGAALLRDAMLRGHNEARRAVGVAPLRWNATLAADAQRYADELARTRKFQHSAEPRGATPEGENLWTGTREAYRYEEMIGHWVDERRFYRHAAAPGFSNSGRWEDVAHYTQIIWSRSTEMGCAIASNSRDDYLVCRYTPPGNVVGQLAY